MMGKHYILQSGLGGFPPEQGEVFFVRELAIQYGTDLYKLTMAQTSILRERGYLYRNLLEHGEDYIELYECDCDQTFSHDLPVERNSIR